MRMGHTKRATHTRALKGHIGNINTVAYSVDGKWIRHRGREGKYRNSFV